MAEEGKVLRVVILVVHNEVYHHPAEHFLYLLRILRQITCQGEEVGVIYILPPEIGFQQGRCGNGVNPLPVRGDVEAFYGEVSVVQQGDARNRDPAGFSRFHVKPFGLSDIRRVVGVSELDKPVRSV